MSLYSGQLLHILSVTVRRKSLILNVLSSLSSLSTPFWRVGGVKVETRQGQAKTRLVRGQLAKSQKYRVDSGHLDILKHPCNSSGQK